MKNVKGRPILISLKETAEILGVHPETVYRMVRLHRLPAVRIGPKIWRVHAATLARLITPEIE